MCNTRFTHYTQVVVYLVVFIAFGRCIGAACTKMFCSFNSEKYTNRNIAIDMATAYLTLPATITEHLGLTVMKRRYGVSVTTA